MTSEERNEKKRVEKRLAVAKALRRKAFEEYSKHYYKGDWKKFKHRWLVLDRRVRRIERTLLGYE